MPGKRTETPILCYVTDRHSLQAESHGRCAALLEQIRRAAEAGVDWVQLREKDLSGRALCGLANGAKKVVGSRSTRILMNDRLDVAWAAGAGGVHLGENSLPVAAATRERRGAPGAFLIGASCHSLAAARQAEQNGADYIFFGPVFATPSKAVYGPAQGLALLAQVCSNVKIAVVAIGGITVENAESCLEAGAAGIAAIRLFQETPELGALVAAIKRSAKAG